MSEKKLIIDRLKIDYSGLVNINDFYRAISAWFYERGYDMFERRNIELNTPKGKTIEIELCPWKKTTDYAKNEIKVRIFAKNVIDKEVDKDDVKIKVQQIEMQIIIDGWLTTDYENRWEKKNPIFIFIRTLADKFIFKSYTNKFESMVVEDVNHLQNRIKSFLNIYKMG